MPLFAMQQRLYLNQAIGRARGVFRSGPVRLLLLLAAIELSGWLAEFAHDKLLPHLPKIKPGTYSDPKLAAAIFILLVLAWWVWNGRRTVVIEEFTDYTTPGGKSAGQARGLSLLLFHELKRVREEYAGSRGGAYRNASSMTENNAFDPSLKLTDPSEILRSAVSTESKLSLGPLSLPIGAFAGLLGSFARGPRVSGGLHSDGPSWIFTVQMADRSTTRSWRVTQPRDTAQRSPDPAFAPSLRELALRIYSDVALGGSVRWQALEPFLEASKLFRTYQRIGGDRSALRLAETKFIESSVEEKKFSKAYYGLGLVYSAFGRNQAALLVYAQARDNEPNGWEPYYAIAKIQFDAASARPAPANAQLLADAVANCTRVIDLRHAPASLTSGRPQPIDLATAYDLKGRAERLCDRYDAAFASRRRAVSLAWRALCKAERCGPDVPDAAAMRRNAREAVALCLNNLAVLEAYRGDRAAKNPRGRAASFRAARFLSRKAITLMPSARYWSERANILQADGRDEDAAKALAAALQFDGLNSNIWARLASVQAAQSRRLLSGKRADPRGESGALSAQALVSCQRAQATMTTGAEAVFDELAKAKRTLGRVTEALGFESDASYLREIAPLESGGDGALQKIMLQSRPNRQSEYQRAQYARLFGYLRGLAYPEDPQAANRVSRLIAAAYRAAIAHFQAGGYPEAVRAYGLRANLAIVLGNQGRLEEALAETRAALRENPLGVTEWRTLGLTCQKMGNNQDALDAFEKMRGLQPHDPEPYYYIARCQLNLAQGCNDRTSRVEHLRDGLYAAETTLGLNEPQDEIRLRYWAGRIAFELGDYEKAVAHFGIVRHQEDGKAIAASLLGVASLQAKLYESAVDACSDAVKEAKALLKSVASPDTLIGAALDDIQPAGGVLGNALCWLAFSCAERRLALADAAIFVASARYHCAQLQDGPARNLLRSNCDDCEGWIILQRVHADPTVSVDRAIALFRSSLRTSVGADTHYHLAIAYARKLDGCTDAGEHRSLLGLIADNIRWARESDRRAYLEERLLALEKEVAAPGMK